MEAIILVGGLGTRLGELTKSTPKPMLPIRGVPFLERLLIFLKENEVSRVILAVGYKKEIVESYFSSREKTVPNIVYSSENSPLGTGGAIAAALRYTVTDDIFVLNGDSFLDVDFKEMEKFHKLNRADITIASHFLSKADRYGVLDVNANKEVVSFEEKGKLNEGLINGGVYLLNTTFLRNIFSTISEKKFSFEETILMNKDLNLNKYHFQTYGYFLDIGIPSDYQKAQSELFL